MISIYHYIPNTRSCPRACFAKHNKTSILHAMKITLSLHSQQAKRRKFMSDPIQLRFILALHKTSWLDAVYWNAMTIICVTERFCNGKCQKKVSIFFIASFVLIYMPGSITNLQDKQHRRFPFSDFTSLSRISCSLQEKSSSFSRQISNTPHLSIIIFRLYCMFTRRTYKIETS